MTLIGENFPPPTGGMSKAVAPFMLPNDKAEFMVDTLLHVPGEIRSRGGFIPAATLVSGRPFTVDSCLGRNSQLVVPAPSGLINATNAPWFVLDDNTIYITDKDFVVKTSATTAYPWHCYATATNHKSVVITSVGDPNYGGGATYSFEWFGGTLGAATATGSSGTTLTGTHSIASTGILTGVGSAYLTEVSIGTILWNSAFNAPIGIVKSVTSDTVCELVDAPWDGKTGAITVKATVFLPPIARVAGGTITTRTAQTVVIGANTQLDQLSTSSALSDAIFIRGSETNKSTFLGYTYYDTAADNPLNVSFRTLGSTTTTTALSASDNAYWYSYAAGIPRTTRDLSTYAFTMYNNMGFWYKQYDSTQPENRIYVSGTEHHADVNVTTSGSWFTVSASQTDGLLRAFPSRFGLLLFNRLSGVRIVTGNNKNNLTMTKLHHSSLYTPTTVTDTPNGVVWVALDGIYLFDGSSITRISDSVSLGAFNKFFPMHNGNTIMPYAALMYSRGYLMFTIKHGQQETNATPTIDVPALEGNNGTVYNRYYVHAPALVMYMSTGTWTWWSNFNFNQSLTYKSTDYLVGSYSVVDANTRSVVMCALDEILENASVDTVIACSNLNPVSSEVGFYRFNYTTSSGTTPNLVTGNDVLGGMYDAYEHRTGLCAFKADGSAYAGTYGATTVTPYGWQVLQNTFVNGANREAEVVATFPVLSEQDTANWISHIYVSPGTATTVLLVRGRTSNTNGWRITFAALPYTVETVTFASATDWTVSSPSIIYTSSNNHFVFEHATTRGGYKVTDTSNNTFVHWRFGRKRSIPGPTPYVVSRAFRVNGVSMWLRKLRLFYRSYVSLGTRYVTNMDYPDEVTGLNASDTLPSTGADSSYESLSNVNQSATVFYGAKAETFQIVIARKIVGASSMMRLFSGTLFFKQLRGARK